MAETAATPEAALAHWANQLGPDPAPTPVAGSLVNRTWAVGSGPDYALQLLAPQFGDPENARIEAVSGPLAEAGVAAPRLVRTDGEALSAAGPDGRCWRLLRWIPGQIHQTVPSPAHARSAAELVARFHDALDSAPAAADLPASDFHDTETRMARLSGAMAESGDEIRQLGDRILAAWRRLGDYQSLPRRPGHGDLKISNIVFDADEGRAVGLIDFDTLARYPLDAELGDAFRSWCNPAGEDTTRPRLDLAIFEAVVTGYLGRSQSLTGEEKARLVAGFARIALELAARFLTDAVYDCYFAWNPKVAPSRSAHNLLRAEGQAVLAAEVVRRRAELEAIVGRY
jgi:Ser/Thr protein kinase RdoA (MazF antagonist)